MNELTGVDRIIISRVPNLSKQILALTGHIIKILINEDRQNTCLYIAQPNCL